MMRRLLSFTLAFALAATAAPAASTATITKPAVAKPAASASRPKPKKEVPEVFPAVEESGPPKIQAAAAIVLDAQSGKVLYEHNADDARAVASTQKLLTGLIIAESGGLDGQVEVEQSDTYAEPSKLYLKAGETYSRARLLQILLVKSMNDVARCLARDNAGSVAAFADKMNAKAAQLGMTSSNFLNPNGLPAPGQYSTARDMSKVAMAAYRNRVIRSIVNQKNVTWRFNDGRVKTFQATNQVLRKWPLCNGMKTGYTNAAGHCLISSASSGGRDVIVVILGDKEVWNDSYRLLSWGLAS
ncbi:MAG TPA: D-alanyl-D-alanine carboxypeptidase family protein [Chthoniobacteraceae bacterium]|jgi:D-alanyl-D-alanine carboxypeptidase (penicillin-binding protein 5/6)